MPSKKVTYPGAVELINGSSETRISTANVININTNKHFLAFEGIDGDLEYPMLLIGQQEDEGDAVILYTWINLESPLNSEEQGRSYDTIKKAVEAILEPNCRVIQFNTMGDLCRFVAEEC